MCRHISSSFLNVFGIISNSDFGANHKKGGWWLGKLHLAHFLPTLNDTWLTHAIQNTREVQRTFESANLQEYITPCTVFCGIHPSPVELQQVQEAIASGSGWQWRSTPLRSEDHVTCRWAVSALRRLAPDRHELIVMAADKATCFRKLLSYSLWPGFGKHSSLFRFSKLLGERESVQSTNNYYLAYSTGGCTDSV